ncbi:MAG TPA: hypothetical protein VER55_12020 [Ardenticatenaceae bacterium]|nr:hypothetical protein [Ardenticatenaceae bacterium]
MSLQYRQQVAFVGALIGAIVGVVGALIYLDYISDQEDVATHAEVRLGFGDMARLATAAFALVRQINEMSKVEEELD